MRENPTPAEQALWQGICAISAREGWDIERQAILSGYIADIFIRNKNVVIEVDGGYHNTDSQRKWDERRDGVMKWRGMRVCRLTNESVLNDIGAAVDSVRNFVEETAPLYYPRQYGFTRGTSGSVRRMY